MMKLLVGGVIRDGRLEKMICTSDKMTAIEAGAWFAVLGEREPTNRKETPNA